MQKLLVTILLTLSLALYARPSTTPDGKMTLHYEDGKMTLYYEDSSKKAEKEYKYEQPIDSWKRWYDNGETWGVLTLPNITPPSYDNSSEIVQIELR